MKNGKQVIEDKIEEKSQEEMKKRTKETVSSYIATNAYRITNDISYIEDRVKDLISREEYGMTLGFLSASKEYIKDEHKVNYNALLHLAVENIEKDLRL